ncbi:SMI1/KNR4 family protein [Cupriavidus sp. JZ107]
MLPSVPRQYRDYLISHGIFEGFTAEGSRPEYVALWSLDEIARNNADVEIEVYAPGFLAFGGDGGGELLAFDHAGSSLHAANDRHGT